MSKEKVVTKVVAPPVVSVPDYVWLSQHGVNIAGWSNDDIHFVVGALKSGNVPGPAIYTSPGGFAPTWPDLSAFAHSEDVQAEAELVQKANDAARVGDVVLTHFYVDRVNDIRLKWNMPRWQMTLTDSQIAANDVKYQKLLMAMQTFRP
jgi:hypothetical protein